MARRVSAPRDRGSDGATGAPIPDPDPARTKLPPDMPGSGGPGGLPRSPLGASLPRWGTFTRASVLRGHCRGP